MSKSKSEQIRENQEAAGIPDSRTFTAPDGELEGGVSRIRQCHINGVLIGEMPLGPEVLSALDYWATDEGIAERNARPEMREPSGISLGVDGFGKALQQRRDDVKDRDINLYEARDPFKEAAQFAGPNMRPKMLSGDAIKNGGTGDWDIVKYPTDHARAGEPVKVRDMVLGQMPEAKAKARNEHYRARGNNMLKQISEKWKAEGGKTAVADQ